MLLQIINTNDEPYLLLCFEYFQFHPNAILQNPVLTGFAAAAPLIALIDQVTLLKINKQERNADQQILVY